VYHRRKLAVAQPRKGATDGGQNERKCDRGPGVVGRGNPGEREQARADDRADTQRYQLDWPQRLLQTVRVIARLGLNRSQRFCGKQVHPSNLISSLPRFGRSRTVESKRR
jgi:hypothetical protein